MQLAASAAARSTLASAAWNKGWTASNAAFLFNNICVSSPSGDGRLLSVRGVGNVDPISEKGTIDRIGAPDERAASATERSPDPQTWLTVQAAASFLIPAFIAAWRAGFWP